MAALDPSFGHALRLLDEILASDGSLSRRDKSVLVVGTKAFGDPATCQPAVQQALALGAGIDELRGVALSLYLSRGRGPAHAVLDALADTAETSDAVPEPATSTPHDLATADIVADFAAVFGEIPPRVGLLEQHCPAALEAYHRMRVAVLRNGALSPMLAELVLFAVNAADHRADYAEVHASGARRAGAGEAQLVEAGLTTIAVGGIAAWLAASVAIAATREDD